MSFTLTSSREDRREEVTTWSRLFAWLFPPETDGWLALLRIGIGLQLALYPLSLRNEWLRFLGGESRRISEAVQAADNAFIPRVGWLVSCGRSFGLTEKSVLLILWCALIAAGLFLLAGLLCRTTSIAAVFLHLAAVKSASIFSYGVDGFTTLGLFYVALSPLPDRYSLDWRWRKLRPRYADLTGFFRRVLQLHICVIYFFSGLSKALGSGWWNGDNLWRALARPPFNFLDPAFVAGIKPSLPILGVIILLLELGYPVFIWPNRTRPKWLLGIIGMHIGIGLFMGMPLFALVMIILNLAAFGPNLRTNADRSSLGTGV